MSCYVIIPARAGSKGVPQKNIQPLQGIPLIAHNIKAALQASKVDKVIVSTDGDDIAAVAREYGADVIKRPDSISGDLDSSESAILHALSELEKESSLPDYTCFSQCTAPFTAAEDFDGAIAMLETRRFDSVFAATHFHYFLWRVDENGYAYGVNHDHMKKRLMRQEREAEYLEAGAFYLFDTAQFRQTKTRFFGRIGLYDMPPERVFEIDDREDFLRAEMLLETR